jgi:NhaP-type Na+/H+ or K+/H+ antiporter
MIWFLGIIGTIIGFILLSGFIFLVNKYLFKVLTLTEVMMISSVMCATDTVAAITLIKSDRYPVLNAVLFGEGIINDAVAIILFRTISELKLNDAGEFTLMIVMEMSFNFTYLFFFSVAFGTITGFGLSYLFK